jgi:hypothetical protein
MGWMNIEHEVMGLYGDYIAADSARHIRLPSSIKGFIDQELHSGVCSINVFSTARAWACKKLEEDAYPDFCRSPQYEELLQELRSKFKLSLEDVLQVGALQVLFCLSIPRWLLLFFLLFVCDRLAARSRYTSLVPLVHCLSRRICVLLVWHEVSWWAGGDGARIAPS